MPKERNNNTGSWGSSTTSTSTTTTTQKTTTTTTPKTTTTTTPKTTNSNIKIDAMAGADPQVKPPTSSTTTPSTIDTDGNTFQPTSVISINKNQSDDGSWQTRQTNQDGSTIERNYDSNNHMLSEVTRDENGNITNVFTNKDSALSETRTTIGKNQSDDGSWQTVQTNKDGSTVERNYNKDGNLLSSVSRNSDGGITNINANSGSSLTTVHNNPTDKTDKSSETDNNSYNGGNDNGYTPSTSTPQGTPISTTPSTSQQVVKVDEATASDIVTRIRKAAEELDNYWSYIKNNCMEKVKASWVANETKSYVDSVLAEERNVRRIIDSLLLLADTYQQVGNQSNNTQQQNANYIQNNI